MKNYGLLILAIFSFFTLSSLTINNESATDNPAHIEFEGTTHDYGNITVGDNGSYSFKFKNTGGEPLIIQDVRTSCGCTVAKKPATPIMPGDSDEIIVKYDTRRLGGFHKTITITSNADNASVILTIKGNIAAKPQETPPVKPESEGFTPTNN